MFFVCPHLCCHPRSGAAQNYKHSVEKGTARRTPARAPLRTLQCGSWKSVCSEGKNSWDPIGGCPHYLVLGGDKGSWRRCVTCPQTAWQRSDSNPAHVDALPRLSLHYPAHVSLFLLSEFPPPFFFENLPYILTILLGAVWNLIKNTSQTALSISFQCARVDKHCCPEHRWATPKSTWVRSNQPSLTGMYSSALLSPSSMQPSWVTYMWMISNFFPSLDELFFVLLGLSGLIFRNKNNSQKGMQCWDFLGQSRAKNLCPLAEGNGSNPCQNQDPHDCAASQKKVI